MSNMRVIFAGTPDFSTPALQSLIDAGFDVVLALTQPDRPSGRGLKLHASPVKELAQKNGIKVIQPHSLKLDGKYPIDALEAKKAIDSSRADIMVVAAYGLILPQWVLDSLPKGCINIHASLLPKWRGAAPIHRAIEAGDTETGITIMQMDAGLDTGDMLLTQALEIENLDTTATLQTKLSIMGSELIVKALHLAQTSSLIKTPQPLTGASYAHKIEKQEAQINWNLSAVEIDRRIRAFSPFPVAQTSYQGTIIKIHSATLLDVDGAYLPSPSSIPGKILIVNNYGINVATHSGSIRILNLQKPNSTRMPVKDFLNGFDIKDGHLFT